jgi:hypothetical protein
MAGMAATAVASAEELRAALAAGTPAIRLASGTYAGPFVIERDVELRGEPGGGVVLTGGSANRTLSITDGATAVLEDVEVRATDQAWMAVSIHATATVTLRRCTLVGGDGPGGGPTAILSWGTLHVEGCRLLGGPGEDTSGICAYGRSIIVDNDIEASHIGVNCGNATVERNRIRAGTYGVYVQGDDVTVRGNHIVLAPPARNVRAVFLVSGERLVVENNTIEGGPDPARWTALPWRSWVFDEVSDREYSEVTITTNGLWFHGMADGPSGGGYTGPTQDLDDFLAHDPVQPMPPSLVDEIRAYLRAFLAAAPPPARPG